jgi:multidrug efflux pump subunit AcrA (membrane-fusion protein)
LRSARAELAQAERNLGQTQGSLVQGQAQLELARTTWDRYRTLVANGVLARQDGDQQLTNFRAASATVQALQANVAAAEQVIHANRANLQRLVVLQEFKSVTAPFAGIVTARNVDVGALISGAGATLGASTAPAGGPPPGSSPTGEMFRMAQIGTLRVLINVPEVSAPAIRAGQTAELTLPAFPGRTFTGHVTRHANALDTNTHTLLTEVQAANPTGELFPGMYAQVQFAIRSANPSFLVPGSAIIVRSEGTRVAVLQSAPDGSPDGTRRIHLQPVVIGRDYGTVTEITQGLQGWEYIAATPGDRVQEGALVRPVSAPSAGKGQGASETRR